MENWEIDVLITGKVMGWECECHSEINTWSTFGEYGALVISEDFAPSIDIRDAWIVVEKLKQEGFYSFHTDLSLDSGQEWWSWHFSKGVNNYGSQQETAPLAICMAALKAFNVEEAVKS